MTECGVLPIYLMFFSKETPEIGFQVVNQYTDQ